MTKTILILFTLLMVLLPGGFFFAAYLAWRFKNVKR